MGAVVSDPDSQVLVVGAGPAGAALAFLLASRGARVTLVERQSDFEREFRGEVVMPSGLRALEQMGVAGALASLPHHVPEHLTLHFDRRPVVSLALTPELFDGATPMTLSQPHLLEHLVQEAERHPGFRLVRGGVVRELLRENGRVRGVRYEGREGGGTLTADLVVGADGRASVARRDGGFAVREIGAPMDVVWCKLPWPSCFGAGWPARAYVGGGHLLVAVPAPDGLLQVAWVILKGTYGELRRRGVDDWVRQMADHVTADLADHFVNHAHEISRPFLLSAATDRVRGWTVPGLLLLGDAAHTMSPVGGQGINLALRDAVVAANHLVPPLRASASPEALDAAAARVEPERAPEIDRIQAVAAIPPRFVMSTGLVGRVFLRLAPLFFASPLRRLGLRQVRWFLDGVVDVRLEV